MTEFVGIAHDEIGQRSRRFLRLLRTLLSHDGKLDPIAKDIHGLAGLRNVVEDLIEVRAKGRRSLLHTEYIAYVRTYGNSRAYFPSTTFRNVSTNVPYGGRSKPVALRRACLKIGFFFENCSKPSNAW